MSFLIPAIHPKIKKNNSTWRWGTILIKSNFFVRFLGEYLQYQKDISKLTNLYNGFKGLFKVLLNLHFKSLYVCAYIEIWWTIYLILKTGYLKRSQRYELAILRSFLAILSQTTLRTFSKVKFWRTFWGAKHV